MKKILIASTLLTALFVLAQVTNPGNSTNPGPGYQLVSSNCSSLKLGFVTITSGSMTYQKTDMQGRVIDEYTVPCSNGDRWHWFWE